MATVERVNPRKTFIAQQILNDAKQYTLDRSLKVVSEYQRAGRFTDDADEIKVFVKQKGKETKRNFIAIKPEFLNIPYSILFRSSGIGQVAEAVEMAYHKAREFAPVRKGTYKRSIKVYVNGYPSTLRAAMRVAQAGIEDEQRIQIIGVTPYAASLEAHYYKSRGGILYKAALQTRDAYPDGASIRFTYISSDQASVSFPRGAIYALPMIEIGNFGAFPENDTRPGTNARKRASRARRKSRRR